MCNHVISFIIFGARYPDKEKGLYFQTAMQHFYYTDVTVFKKAFLFLFEHLWLWNSGYSNTFIAHTSLFEAFLDF